MSPRRPFRFLIAGLILVSLLVFVVLPVTVSKTVGQEPETKSSANPLTTTYPTRPAANIPAPPARRHLGIFDFHAGSPSEQKIHAALIDPKGVEISFIDTPLKDAMEFLADAHEITILIDQTALTDAQVAVDEPISATLSNIKLESALKILLEPLGLTYIIEDEVLKITTIPAADRKQFTRVYNTGYLMQIGIDPEALTTTIRATIAPDSWRGRPSEPAASAEKQAVVYRDNNGRFRTENLPMTTILRSVEVSGKTPPDKNQPAGNSIEALGDMLVVSAPQSVHAKVRGLLIQLDRRWELEQGGKQNAPAAP